MGKIIGLTFPEEAVAKPSPPVETPEKREKAPRKTKKTKTEG